MASHPRAFAQPIPFPEHFERSFHFGATCAAAWFRDPTTSMARFRDTMRSWHVDRVIFSHEPGRIPMADAFDGFTAGFERGVAEQIAGGVRHG